MKYLFALLIAFGLYADGFTPYTTIQMGRYDNVTSNEARFGLKYDTKYAEPYIEHIATISSTTDTEGQGLNIIGMNIKTCSFRGAKAYGGYFAIPVRYNSIYYKNSDDEYGVRYGFQYQFNGMKMYLERFNNKETTVGMLWEY